MKLAKLVVLVVVFAVGGCNPFSRGKEITQRIYGWGRQGVLTGYDVSRETVIETIPEQTKKGLNKAGEVILPEASEEGGRVIRREIIRLKRKEPQIRRRIWTPSSYLESPELVETLRSAGYLLTCNQLEADLGLKISLERDQKEGLGSKIDQYKVVAALFDRSNRLVAYGAASSFGSGRVRLPFRFGRGYGNSTFSIPDLGGQDRAIKKAVIAMIYDHQGLHQPE